MMQLDQQSRWQSWMRMLAVDIQSLPESASLIGSTDRVFPLAINGWNGQPVPGLAPAAKQAGTYIGRLIRAKIEGRSAPVPGLSHVSSGIRLITGHSAITEASFRSFLTR
jgi:hypothetical protein